MRDIAERCGISVGNLTYHFPTRKCLLMTVVDHVCESYLREFRKLFSSGLAQKGMSIESFAEYFLRDAATLKTSRLFRELWAMSSHYPEVHKKVADLYNKLSDSFVCHVSQIYPELPRHTLETIICFLGILTEGTTVLYGSRYSLPVDDSEMLPIMVSVFSKYIKSVTSPRKGHRRIASKMKQPLGKR